MPVEAGVEDGDGDACAAGTGARGGGLADERQGLAQMVFVGLVAKHPHHAGGLHEVGEARLITHLHRHVGQGVKNALHRRAAVGKRRHEFFDEGCALQPLIEGVQLHQQPLLAEEVVGEVHQVLPVRPINARRRH